MLLFSLYVVSIYYFHIIVKLIVICQYDYFFKSCYSYQKQPSKSFYAFMAIWIGMPLNLRAIAMKKKMHTIKIKKEHRQIADALSK